MSNGKMKGKRFIKNSLKLHSKQPKTSLSHSKASGYSLQSRTNS